MGPDQPDEDVPPVTLDELNRRLAAVTRAMNHAPDPGMGGLSPEQVAKLIYTEWGEPGGAVQFHTDIPLAEGRYEQERKFYETLKAVRTTPLYARVFRFDIE